MVESMVSRKLNMAPGLASSSFLLSHFLPPLSLSLALSPELGVFNRPHLQSFYTPVYTHIHKPFIFVIQRQKLTLLSLSNPPLN